MKDPQRKTIIHTDRRRGGLTALQISNIIKGKAVAMSGAIPPKFGKVISRESRPIRAQRVVENLHTNIQLLLQTPTFSNSSRIVEWPTPDWFKTHWSQTDVSVVVPLYNSDNVLLDQIKSWDLDNSGLKVEIIYVDDHCPRNSKSKIVGMWEARKEEIRGGVGKVLYNLENTGFGGACNAGAWAASGKYVIFLNADTKVSTNWIKPIVRVMKADPSVGIVGNMQLKDGGVWDGTIDSAGSEWLWGDDNFLHIGRHTYHGKHLSQPIHLDNAPSDLLAVSEREMVTGCCMAFDRELFLKMGGFDINYRTGYWEDSDICLRFREKGYKIIFQPNSKIHHKLAHSESSGHPYQMHNHDFFFNRWVNSGRIDPLVKQARSQKPAISTILLQRQGARGDVLVAAAIAPALRKKYNGCNIVFNTRCPDMLQGNPHISRIINNDATSERQAQLIVNLDMVYEVRPNVNILTSFAEVAGVKTEDCELFLSISPVVVPEKYVAIHAGNTAWIGRNWTAEKFDAIARKLIERGEKVVCIGENGDNHITCDLDLRGQTNVSQLGYVIKNASLFIGIDSLPMHIAQTFQTPGVVFFGSIVPETRLIGKCITPIMANVECLGCHHRRLPPCVVTNMCDTENIDCVRKLSVEQFWDTVESKLRP